MSEVTNGAIIIAPKSNLCGVALGHLRLGIGAPVRRRNQNAGYSEAEIVQAVLNGTGGGFRTLRSAHS